MITSDWRIADTKEQRAIEVPGGDGVLDRSVHSGVARVPFVGAPMQALYFAADRSCERLSRIPASDGDSGTNVPPRQEE